MNIAWWVWPFFDHTKQRCSNKTMNWNLTTIDHYIYIYTRFQKGFHTERYIDRYIFLFSCTSARVYFSLVIYCPTCEKVGSKINFSIVGFFVPIWHVVWVFFFFFFLEKYMRPAIQICNGELYGWVWEWGKHPLKQPIRELYGVTELVGQMPWHL